MFEQINHKYFAGQLTDVQVQWGNLATEKARGFTCFYDNGDFLIEIDRKQNPSPHAAFFALDHEACHVATHALVLQDHSEVHGATFQNCMVRFRSKAIHPGQALAVLFAKGH